MERNRIFISYKRADREKVIPIIKEIEEKLGEKCWVDLNGIESSEQFASKICKAIDNAEAKCYLGFCYQYGKGVDQEHKEAVKWFTRASKQGNIEAQYNLGHFYFYGCGVEKNQAEAVRWFRKAAEQGLAIAQMNLQTAIIMGWE